MNSKTHKHCAMRLAVFVFLICSSCQTHSRSNVDDDSNPEAFRDTLRNSIAEDADYWNKILTDAFYHDSDHD